MTKLETGKSSKGASNLVSKFGKPDKKFFACDAGVPEQSKCFVKAPAVANVDIDQVKAGVGAFFKYLEKTAESKLFDEEEAIFLQVAAVKVPKCPSRQIRLSLCHSLVSDSSEVCLIVPDVGMPKEVSVDSSSGALGMTPTMGVSVDAFGRVTWIAWWEAETMIG